MFDFATLLLKDAVRLQRAQRQLPVGQGDALARWQQDFAAARGKAEARFGVLPELRFDEALPISLHVEQLVGLIQQHQVVVVDGATGSGKSTQLPKICLAAGRGRRGLIGCTQPRRIAAKSVARRVADELKSTLGARVGYQVRFNEQVGEQTLIKFMTDGILLAETPSDRWLNAYDTLIIDEAHERSLNIDFLLGYLRQLLPKRPDLKLIITSATIDSKRFSEHFGGAPVVSVEGRGFPVTIRYQAPDAADERDERDLGQDIVAAVETLNRDDPNGDILVFLPGEREIREVHQSLNQRKFAHTEVRALYARLSMAEQDRVFTPGPERRIVLATNVAETSITVPRIRFVIDTGTARVARYSHRAKVQRLHIEPISQAAANQRAGRCGRTAPGICLRLYDAQDFAGRPDYTDPEILRSSLAGVILRMAKLKLGDPARFPFLDPPGERAINDGYQLLTELEALDARRQLTAIGSQMADWPIDVRLARLLLAGKSFDCLHEMLVLASGLSIQDPRERPFEQRQQADACHAVHQDERSDFAAMLKLWEACEFQRQELSSNQMRAWTQRNFISFMRLREWRELHRQLLLQCRALGWVLNVTAAPYEALHQALLRGFVTQIGERDEKGWYRSTRSRIFQVFPGSGQARTKHRWLLAGSMLDTERLWGMMCARIDPLWLEAACQHLSSKRHYDPHWDAPGGRVVGFEDVNMLGLTLVHKRRVSYEAIDPKAARELFLRHALIRGEVRVTHALFTHNANQLEWAQEKEEKLRKRGLLRGEDELLDWLEARVPAGIASVSALLRALRAERTLQARLQFDLDALLKPDGHDVQRSFPVLLPGQLALPVSYHFDPQAEDDGVTVTIKLEQLKRLDARELDWLVPGMHAEKATALIKSLDKALRRHFVPAPDFAQAFLEDCAAAPEPATTARPRQDMATTLAAFLSRVGGLAVSGTDFQLEALGQHLRINLRLLDEQGALLAQSRSLRELLQRYGGRADTAFAANVESSYRQDGLLRWPELSLPAVLQRSDGSKAYPALVDQQTGVGIRVFATQAEADAVHRAGLRRLLMLDLADELKYWRRHLPLSRRAELNYATVASPDALRRDMVEGALQAVLDGLPEVRERSAFAQAASHARRELGSVVKSRSELIEPILIAYGELKPKLQAPMLGFASGNLDDLRAHLERLVGPELGAEISAAQLKHYPRYLRALAVRYERLLKDPVRDQARMLEAQALERAAAGARSRLDRSSAAELHLLLEEYRVSQFAQELGTAVPVSAKRIGKLVGPN